MLVTSAKGKQDCKNWHRYFSLNLFEVWYERNFFHKKLPSEAAIRRCSFKKFVLKTFSVFTRKHLKAWRPAILFKRDTKTGVFLWQFSRTLFLQHISVDRFCRLNGWIFYVLTFYLLDLIPVLRNQAPVRRF